MNYTIFYYDKHHLNFNKNNCCSMLVITALDKTTRFTYNTKPQVHMTHVSTGSFLMLSRMTGEIIRYLVPCYKDWYYFYFALLAICISEIVHNT